MRTARPKTRRRDPALTRRRLLRAGTVEFATLGFEGATLDAISRRARVNKAMIGYHFRCKRDLYYAILDEMIGDVVAQISVHLSLEGDPVHRLRSYIGLLTSAIAARPHLPAMLLREYLSGWFAKDAELVLRLSTLFKITADILRAGEKDGCFRALDPHLFHLMLMGSITYFLATDRFRRDAANSRQIGLSAPSMDEFAQQLIAVCEAGIRARN